MNFIFGKSNFLKPLISFKFYILLNCNISNLLNPLLLNMSKFTKISTFFSSSIIILYISFDESIFSFSSFIEFIFINISDNSILSSIYS